MFLIRGPVAAAAIAAGAGCSAPAPGPPCELGSDGTPPQVVAVYTDRNGRIQDLVDGAAIPLIAPPQGGHIAKLGVRMTEVAGCSVDVTAALRDPCNNRVVGLERRPITLRDRGDGWAVPVDPGQLENFANVAVCPVQAASHDLDGHPYIAEVKVHDGAAILAEIHAVVVPSCDDDYCRCDCDLEGGPDCAIEPDAATDCPGPDAAPVDAALVDAL